MKLLNFFMHEVEAPKLSTLLPAVVSGIANGMVLGIINSAAALIYHPEDQVRLFFLFLSCLVLYVVARKISLVRTTIAVEQAIRRMRMRIVDKLRQTDLIFIENSGRSEIFTRLTHDANVISQSAVILVSAAQATIVLVSCLLYIAWISLPGFLITIIFLGTAVAIYLFNYKIIAKHLNLSIRKEGEFFDSLNHTLDGFKEIKINSNKSQDLFEHIETISITTQDAKVEAGKRLVGSSMFAQTSFYILIAVTIFVLPILSTTFIDDVVKITIAILFLSNPLEMVVGAMPMFTRANVAVANVYQLEEEIDAVRANGYHAGKEVASPMHFESIGLEGVCFDYKNSDGDVLFSVGPIDLTIQRGEMVFIVGGNGSGKSTLLKLLIALYSPSQGHLHVDHINLERSAIQSYRELFAIIFSDFHLFDRLYGLKDVDPQRVNQFIKTMQLQDKTRYVDGKFSNANLSTGQRKRLAYIAATLEDKPIYIFDEWAADQDPEFRHYFYEQLLPDLKSKGKTIIAVTHDDRFFSVADRVIKVEQGCLTHFAPGH